MTIRWITLLAFTFLAFPERIYALIERTNKPESIDPWNQWTAMVNENVYLSWRFLLLPEGIRVSKGEYKISQEVIIDEKRYALIPAMTGRPDRSYVWKYTIQDSLDSSCYFTKASFLLVDIATGTPLDRAFETTTGSSLCSERSFFPYALEKPAKLEMGTSIVFTKQFQNENEYRAYLKDIETKNANAKQDQYNLRAINNSSKQKIGTRVCKAQGSTVFIGYTEKVSPDNGKIQVRISDARSGGPNGRSMDDFKETIIWEDPTLWDLCE